jgi:5-methylthioadenosine/S-adenosylhomocysteine deaminase
VSGDWVLTLDEANPIDGPGSVAVTGDRIVWVGKKEDAARIEAGTRIDRPGCALLPGLVNAHTHLFQTLIRGLGDDLGLLGWIRHVVWPFVDEMTDEDLYIASLVGAIEAARSGTTCILENHYALTDLRSTMRVRDALEQVGMRGIVARGVVGARTQAADHAELPNTLFRFSGEEELEILEECLKATVPGGLVSFWPSPLMLSFVDADLTAKAIRLGRRYGAGWHTHCAEIEVDNSLFREVNDVAPVEWLAAEGLLGPDATLAHGVWLTGREIELLAEHGGTVVYNPVSNGFCGVGVLPLRRLRNAGVNVALGTDGPGSNNTVDMIEVLKVGVLLQKAAHADVTATSAEEVLRLAFHGGAACVGMTDDLGRLAAGRLADLIAIDLTGAHTTPVHDLTATLVYGARGADVRLTMVGGKTVFDGDKVIGVDEKLALSELRERAFSIAGRLGNRLARRRPCAHGRVTAGALQ